MLLTRDECFSHNHSPLSLMIGGIYLGHFGKQVHNYMMRNMLSENNVKFYICSEQIHCGTEGDLQGTDREVSASSSVEKRNGDSN